MSHRTRKAKKEPNPAFAPISAQNFFVQAFQVALPGRNLDCRVYYTPPKFANGTVMVCQHGAGYSGLSFACMAKEITDLSGGECGVLAIDARRHGKLLRSLLGTGFLSLSLKGKQCPLRTSQMKIFLSAY